MGHVDHGKSSLLDYIRNTNVVAGESGGITQHLSAYEINLPRDNGVPEKITFIDTPGHAAFSNMRHRGARAADIAILIVSAEEGVKTQTIEAIQTILSNKVPYIVAINKIDRPNANPERVKTELMEAGVYVEGYGGQIPCIAISAKTGVGVDDLLETILILAEVENFTGDRDVEAEGFVIESHLDEKRGISATLIIKNGTLRKGHYIACGEGMTPLRIVEDFMGKPVDEATFSSPVHIIGWSTLPDAGEMFHTYANKRDAEEATREYAQIKKSLRSSVSVPEGATVIPIIIKSDVIGTGEAIQGEIERLSTDKVVFKVIKNGVGAISEGDITLALSDRSTIIVGFHVDIDRTAKDVPGYELVTISLFDVIYKLTEWLAEEGVNRKPKEEVEIVDGELSIIKVFSESKDGLLVGGKITAGEITVNAQCKILEGSTVIGKGKIVNMQKGKAPAQKGVAGEECGIMLKLSEGTAKDRALVQVIHTEIK
jgi:translation initiation factor IF-2